jgi:hypothetical protein
MRRHEQASELRYLGERVAKLGDDLERERRSRKRGREEEQAQRDLLAAERRAPEEWDAELRKNQAELGSQQRGKPSTASRRAHLNSLVRTRATPRPRTENDEPKTKQLVPPKIEDADFPPEGPPNPRYEVIIDSGHYEGWRKKL